MAEQLFRSLHVMCVAVRKRFLPPCGAQGPSRHWAQPCRRSSMAESIGLQKRLWLITREALRDGIAHQFRRRVKIQLFHEAGLVKFDGFHGHMEQ